MRAAPRRDLNATLALHAAQYPEMEPADAVKLVYQSVFGGGHLVANAEESLRFLSVERAAARKNIPAHTLFASFEPIGFGFIRLHLAGREVSPLPDTLLNSAFVLSSRSPHGGTPLFLASLRVLEKAVSRGVFPFSKDAFDDYLANYRAAGCPMARHSEAYRRAYAPAYRVLSGAYTSALGILCQLNEYPPHPERLSELPGISPQTRRALNELLPALETGG